MPTFFEDFFLNAVLPIFAAGAILGLVLAYVRNQPIFRTIAFVEGLGVLIYVCVVLFVIAPVLGIGAAIAVIATLTLLWRGNVIQKDIPTLLVGGLGMATVVLLFG